MGVFCRRNGRIRLEEFAAESLPLASGGEEDWREQTRLALARLRRRSNVRGPVVLVLPAHLTLTKRVHTPRVASAQREKILRFEAEQNIPSPLNEVVWECLVVGESEPALEVLLAAAKLEVVEPLCAAAEAAGFEPWWVLPSSLATLAAFRLTQSGGPECALVLNCGVRWTTFLLVEPKGFSVRTFCLGDPGDSPPSREPPADLAGAVGPDQPAVDLRPRAEASAAGAARLLQEVVRSLQHFLAPAGKADPARICLGGTIALRAALGANLATTLKLSVEPFEVRPALDCASAVVAREVASSADPLIDLVGAAVTQLQAGHPILNLLPQPRRQRADFQRRQPALLAAAVLFLAALLPPLFHFHRLAREAQEKTASLQKNLAPGRALELRQRAKLDRLADLTEQLARLDSLAARRRQWVELLGELEDRLAQVGEVWLERLELVPGESGAPLKLALSGTMLDPSASLPPASLTAYARVSALRTSFAAAPWVAAVENERFDRSQPGLLKFDLVLVPRLEQPL